MSYPDKLGKIIKLQDVQMIDTDHSDYYYNRCRLAIKTAAEQKGLHDVALEDLLTLIYLGQPTRNFSKSILNAS